MSDIYTHVPLASQSMPCTLPVHEVSAACQSIRASRTVVQVEVQKPTNQLAELCGRSLLWLGLHGFVQTDCLDRVVHLTVASVSRLHMFFPADAS